MKYKLFAGLAALFFGAVMALQSAHADKRFLGEWYTKDNKSKVAIRKCGDKLCGKIVWLKEPNKKDGTPKTDANNPDEKLRPRKIVGLELLFDFVATKDKNHWEDGKIYNPEDGDTYSCTLTLKENGTLEVHGYVGVPLFGKTQVWTRPKS